jgi:TonB-linked SusC/RagA family outer membrane protein
MKKRLVRVAIVMLPIILFSLWSFGQANKVHGTVTSETGVPMVGVNVVILGTTIGTITDPNGEYQIEANAESTLTFSFLGYLSESMVVGNQTEINITLVPDIMQLQDVVVVGYGTQRKATLTGSVSNVAGGEITKSPSVNVATSLQGKLPGLTINQRDGWPGKEDLNILIRGKGSIDSDPNDYLYPNKRLDPNEVLVIVDGVPRDNLSRLNPEDIESVSVLKDGSAAIYGARGANGVILVTTKKGSRGAAKFNLSYSHAFMRPTNIPDMLDAATFAEVRNDALLSRVNLDSSLYRPFFSDSAIIKYRDGSDPVRYPNTDWPSEVMKDYCMMRKINLQASGGTENINYFLSFGMNDQNGFLKNDPTHYKQYNTRVRIDADLTKSFSVGANINALINERTFDANGAPFDENDFVHVWQSNPTLVAVYPNGLIAPGRFQNNPLLADRAGYNKFQDYPIYTTFTAKYEVPFLKGLTVDASYNYDLRNEFQKKFRKPAYYHEYNVVTGEYEQKWQKNPIEVRDTYRKWTTSLYNLRISYQKTIGQGHNVSVMAGNEQQKSKHTWAEAYRKNFLTPAIPQVDRGSSDPEDITNSGSAWETAYNNYFGRLNYNFRSRYMAEFLFRYDGSQIFPKGKRYGFFPAVSAGWRLSEERFISDNLPFVSELKLRASYGELGNDRVKQWQYMQSFEFADNYVLGGNDVTGLSAAVASNPDITWEVSKKTDVGLVTELWKGLLGADVTVFLEKRSNILWKQNLSIPKILGISKLPDENIGKVDNHGFEVVLSHRNTIGDLTYSINVNTSFTRSKVIFIDEVPQSEPYQAATGLPVDAGLYYKCDGIFNTQEEFDSYPHIPGAKLGDIKILDLNGDTLIDANDQYRVKYTATPEYIFGLTTNFQYKGFDLTLFFQGQTNAYSYDYTLTELGQADLDNNVVYRATNRWRNNNQEGATMPRSDMTVADGAMDFFLYDATFIRLKNAELGYSLPVSILSIVKLNSLRLFVNGTNLLTWAKKITWRDPEMDGDFTDYPPMRIINFGVNVGF